jgi:hypothetical protein
MRAGHAMSEGQIAARRAVIALLDGDTEPAAALPEAAWQQVAAIARDHRLGPLLHHQAPALQAAVPAALRDEWASAFRCAAMRSLQVQRTLVQASRAMAALGIDHAALKGAWLAWHGYAHPALRPMRDVDFLVDPARIRDAHAALGEAGFAARPASVPIDHALSHHKHLPPLVSSQTGVAVELHIRLTDSPPPPRGAPLFDDPPRLLARSRPLPYAGHGVPCLDPTDSLLHLIVHAVIDHRFDNGPLILTDVEAALRSPIDWPRLWTMARRNGWDRACALVLALARRHRGAMPLLPAVPDVPDAVLDAATALMVAPARKADRIVMGLGIASPAGAGRSAAMLRRIVPARHTVAIFAGVPSDSAGVWRHYPRWALSRARSLWRTRRPDVRADIDRYRRVGAWLGDAAPGR